VKAGSIVPMGKLLQYTSEKPMDTLEVRVYTGADGQFTLYSDEGNNYNYEKGKYTVIPFKWSEQQQTLTIDRQQGTYTGALKKCVLHIVWVNESNGGGIDISPKAKTVVYTGEKINITKR
jgi:alpha-D-xyloside xylohydrolase